MINYSMFSQEIEPDVESPTSLESEEGGRLIAPQEAFIQTTEAPREATTRKMEMVADDDLKMRMYERARMAVEVCDQELLHKTRKFEELMLERHMKRSQIQELEKIVRLKLAEVDMFQLKANEAKQEVLRLRRIALASEEEYVNGYLKQRFWEAEAEKQYLIDKIRLEESSRASN